MELALSWMSRYVGPTPSSWGGAMGCGGSVEGRGGGAKSEDCATTLSAA